MKGQLLRGCMHPQRKLVVLMGSFTPRGRPADTSVQIWRRRCATTQTQNARSAPSLALLLLSQTSSFAPKFIVPSFMQKPPHPAKPSLTFSHTLFYPPVFFFFFLPTGRWHRPPRPSIKFPFGIACTDSPLSARRCQPVSMAS